MLPLSRGSKIADSIIAEVINVQTKPMKPLTPKQEEGLKGIKEKEKTPQHNVIENKGKPKVLLSDPKSKKVKLVELDNTGKGKEI